MKIFNSELMIGNQVKTRTELCFSYLPWSYKWFYPGFNSYMDQIPWFYYVIEFCGFFMLFLGEGWGMMASGSALVFIDNHDNQRGHGAGGRKQNRYLTFDSFISFSLPFTDMDAAVSGDMILTFRVSKLYKVCCTSLNDSISMISSYHLMIGFVTLRWPCPSCWLGPTASLASCPATTGIRTSSTAK